MNWFWTTILLHVLIVFAASNNGGSQSGISTNSGSQSGTSTNSGSQSGTFTNSAGCNPTPPADGATCSLANQHITCMYNPLVCGDAPEIYDTTATCLDGVWIVNNANLTCAKAGLGMLIIIVIVLIALTPLFMFLYCLMCRKVPPAQHWKSCWMKYLCCFFGCAWAPIMAYEGLNCRVCLACLLPCYTPFCWEPIELRTEAQQIKVEIAESEV